MNHPADRQNHDHRPVVGTGPLRPPNGTGVGVPGAGGEEPHIDIPDPVVVRDLASALRLKPFRIIADLLEVGEFASAQAKVRFELAAQVARKHGFHARCLSK
jgi:translation initiation factor IF-2